MRLLFDEMLSPKLVLAVSEEFPDCEAVQGGALKGAFDAAVWEYARANGLVIVTKDDDYREQSLVYGPPPKVLLLNVPNGPTPLLAELIRSRAALLREFDQDPDAAMLELHQP